ncbi:MAG: exodeoxyribonuclease VII small subunit [Bacteroidaceae bacterium]|nr:exodeoxyribonuclease VII small subunit [Bacteroidaceae bacterium]
MKKKETYTQSIQRLEQIVQQIDSGELDIDELAEKIKEAKAIIAFCTEKLTHVDKEVEILLSDGQ